jgi:dTDP-4-dehydrorhamnose reductase
MLKLGESRDELSVVDDQVGSPTYAADLAQACVCIMQKVIQDELRAPGTYHYSNAGACSWYGFAEEIFRLSQPMTLTKTSSDKFPRPAKRPQFSKLDSSKLEETFGLKTRPWQEALHECMGKLKPTL